MLKIEYSQPALEDLRDIWDYTVQAWSFEQAERYLDDLDNATHRLTQNPRSGRPADDISNGLRRREHAKHVIFYRIREDHIFVSRILHQQMLPERHRFE